MPNSAALIEEVYINPIKSVLFIDDKFPTYADAINNSNIDDANLDPEALKIEDDAQYENPFTNTMDAPSVREFNSTFPDIERALKLTQSCRECGYIFDVENSAETALKYEKQASFINKADLVVLDFILDDKTGSSKDALSVIELLNETTRFNLVVVYTNNEPTEVANEIAHFLRGKNGAATFSKKAKKRVGEFSEELLSKSLTDYLSGKSSMLELYKSLGLEGQPSEEDLTNLFEDCLNRRFPDSPSRPASLVRCCGTAENQSPWICGKAVFISVIKKNDTDVTVTALLETLKNCLKSYVPSPISMLIHKSINTLKEGGTELLEKAFGDEVTRAALLYRALKADFPAADEGRKTELCLSDLMFKAFSVLSSGIQRETLQFGKMLLEDCRGQCPEEKFHSMALDKEKVKTPCDDGRLFLNVNAFLCSQPTDTGHITTGSVFRRNDKPSEVWICVTPACDMVPERSRSGYRGKLSPANYFEALKVERVTDPEAVLQHAEQANHLFLKIEGDIQAFSICAESSNELKTYVFYTKNGGYVDEMNSMMLNIIEPNGEKTLVMNEYQFKIIGQLRPEYASRYLAIKGDWNSRIGVDFVNYPER